MVPQILSELLVCGALMFFGAPANAGLYHTKTAGACQDCHRNGAATQPQAPIASLATPPTQPRSFAPSEVTQTCLTCHGGRGQVGQGSSVLLGPTGNLVRQAGFLNGPSGFAHTGHTLGSTQRAPGGTWTPGPQGLTCTDCHDPHGQDGQYRNLVMRPGTATEDRPITYVVGPGNDTRKDIWIHAILGGTEKYDAKNIRFNQPQAERSAYGEWCQGCHSSFHGGGKSANMRGARGWMRHPTADARIGAGTLQHSSFIRYRSLSNRVPTMSASGSWPAADNTPSCMSCHKAHGNNNPFGLLYMVGEGQLTEGGDSQGKAYVDLCHQCHTQGLSSASS
jgi:doubled CXXCH motif protein